MTTTERRCLFACGVELVLENGKLTIPGKSNDGQLRQEYADKLASMTEDEFFEACKKYIWFSAYANNNPRSDYYDLRGSNTQRDRPRVFTSPSRSSALDPLRKLERLNHA